MIAVKSLYYLACFALIVVVLHCCAYATWLESLVIVAAGYAVQHLSYNIFALMMNALHLEQVFPDLNYTVVHVMVFALVCLVIYWLPVALR